MNVYDLHHIEIAPVTVIPMEYALDRELATKEAKVLGLNVVEAEYDTLQLDFDTDEQWKLFIDERLPRLYVFMPIKRVWWTESKSGNKHVYVKLADEWPETTRIALQAALGSDPTREFLNVMRHNAEVESPILLFEKPDAVEHVIYATDGYQPSLAAGDTQLMLTAGEPPYFDDIPY